MLNGSLDFCQAQGSFSWTFKQIENIVISLIHGITFSQNKGSRWKADAVMKHTMWWLVGAFPPKNRKSQLNGAMRSCASALPLLTTQKSLFWAIMTSFFIFSSPYSFIQGAYGAPAAFICIAEGCRPAWCRGENLLDFGKLFAPSSGTGGQECARVRHCFDSPKKADLGILGLWQGPPLVLLAPGENQI